MKIWPKIFEITWQCSTTATEDCLSLSKHGLTALLAERVAKSSAYAWRSSWVVFCTWDLHPKIPMTAGMSHGYGKRRNVGWMQHAQESPGYVGGWPCCFRVPNNIYSSRIAVRPRELDRQNDDLVSSGHDDATRRPLVFCISFTPTRWHKSYKVASCSDPSGATGAPSWTRKVSSALILRHLATWCVHRAASRQSASCTRSTYCEMIDTLGWTTIWEWVTGRKPLSDAML
jgi:hypothetical protein